MYKKFSGGSRLPIVQKISDTGHGKLPTMEEVCPGNAGDFPWPVPLLRGSIFSFEEESGEFSFLEFCCFFPLLIFLYFLVLPLRLLYRSYGVATAADAAALRG